ncbi:hypothetical protein ACOAKC_01240 [Hathewaya histolytica]|uniref:hypothetical protein n=1 Tax=Hathewaya histolytica TaxID=1498 RepID=UPI003B6711D3
MASARAELTYKLILKKRATKEKARKEADTHGIENYYKIEGRMRHKKGFLKSVGAYGRKI